MEDKYFKERANDVLDIKKRILANLLNVQLPDITLIKDEVIIVANDLTPSQTALLDKKYVKGFITKIGGKTSHAAIIARSMEIPAILGVDNILQVVSKNNILIGMDGSSGEIEVEVENIKK
jgi:phosphotransferase system enzyme I (PtsI)